MRLSDGCWRLIGRNDGCEASADFVFDLHGLRRRWIDAWRFGSHMASELQLFLSATGQSSDL